MKNTIVLIISLLLLNCTNNGNGKGVVQNYLPADDSIRILSTPDLYSLTAKWAEEFSSLNPGLAVTAINVADSSIADHLNNKGSLAFVSSKYSALYDESMWNMVIGRDVIVPVFNSRNPFKNEICQQGISSDRLVQLIKNPEMQNWGLLLNSNAKTPVNLYLISEGSKDAGKDDLLGIGASESDCIRVQNARDLITSIKKDPYSLGIFKMSTLIDLNHQSATDGIKLLPIDRNGNGKIDYMERIYDDISSLSRGVWIGKYPGAFFNNIYSISREKPTDKAEIAFLKWILSDGQQILDNYGYSNLLIYERQANAGMLDAIIIDKPASKNNYAYLKGIALFLLLFGALIYVINLVRKKFRIEKAAVPEDTGVKPLFLNEEFVDIPLGLYYDRTHTWAFMEKDGSVKIGIDDFLQHVTGPLTQIKMKSTGEKIRKGKQVLSIAQNGKQLNIYSPLSGTIKEKNEELDSDSSLLNSSPYSDGWVYRIEPSNWLKEMQFLFMGEKYKDWLRNEFTRLKEFLAVSLRSETFEQSRVLQDGGELRDSVLRDLGPEVWEDFQTDFIDLA